MTQKKQPPKQPAPLDNTLGKLKEHAGTKNLIPAKKGEPSRNPKGRPKGSRNKLGEAFLADFLAEWEKSGAAALQRVALTEPATFIKVAASILPKHINVETDTPELDKFLRGLNDDELDKLLRGLAAVGGAGIAKSGEQRTDTKKVGSQPNSVH